MFGKIINQRSLKVISMLMMVVVVAVAALITPTPASAHCDSRNGPVAKAALKALQVNDVKVVLPYVKPEAEAELTAAFNQTMKARQQGGTAKDLAEQYFMETAIRLHRLGEGATYDGMKDDAVPAAIATADQAMASGSMDGVYKMLDQAIQKSLQEKYQALVHAREQAAQLKTVEAYREQAEAELMFEKFVYELYGAATASGAHAEGQATGHAH